MEGHISKKVAKQLIKKATQAIEGNPRIDERHREHYLFLVGIVEPGNCPQADQDMLHEFINGY